MTNQLRERLTPWLQVQRNSSSGIAELRRIATGHSRAMWFVAMDDGERFVARIEQGGVFGSSGSAEFEFMKAAFRLGLPVAEVRWNEPTGFIIGQPFFIMNYVDHVATAPEDRTLDAEVADDFVRRLSELHRADWSREFALAVDTDQVTHAQIDRWLRVYRTATPAVPLLDEAAAWLHRYAPAPSHIGIVHGDPGPGNFLHDGKRVIALTDWEFSHIGDPNEDWVFLALMRGSRTMPLDSWTQLVERVAGVRLSDQEIRYWTAFNLFKGACANITCRTAFAGPNPSPNMAIIGTALHQTFLRRLADLIAR
jgi:aminoglycoside phosphotransferase (APT) family kinase protein